MTERTAKPRFFRAIGDPKDEDYDLEEDDSLAMAYGASVVGMSGWFECASCGHPDPIHACLVTTPNGHRYAYGLCDSCQRGLHEETHFAVQPDIAVRDPETVMVPDPMTARVEVKGPIGRRINEALDRFIAAGLAIVDIINFGFCRRTRERANDPLPSWGRVPGRRGEARGPNRIAGQSCRLDK